MIKHKKYILVYLLGSLLQIGLLCIVKFILEVLHIQYPEFLNMLFLIVGGTSSAVWGIIISKKSGRFADYKNLLKDYFGFKQPLKFYGIVVLFILIVFGLQLFTARISDGVVWYTFPIFFLQSIIFGGIEEIGWRYTFQPMTEKYMSFEIASIVTFLSWGIWHYMYFYITDSFAQIQHLNFLIGLLGNCFILGAIYKLSNSLWLCVLYHCLLNMFSQTMTSNNLSITIICNSVCILLSILLVRKQIV